jgi:uroporphyrinogen-III synthase
MTRPTLVLTRPAGLDAPLARALEAAGWPVVVAPAIAFEPIHDQDAVHLAALDRNDWIALTSRHAAEEFFARIPAARIHSPIAAGGEGTAETVRARGGRCRLVADPPGADVLAARLLEELTASPASILFPAAEEPRHEGAERLRAAGHRVTHWPLYRTIAAPVPATLGPTSPVPLVVVLRSPSAARSFLAPWKDAPRRGRLVLVAGGPTTAGEIERLHFPVARICARPDDGAVRDAVLAAAHLDTGVAR